MLKSKTTPIGTGELIDDHILQVYIHTGVELDREKLLHGYDELADLAGGKFVLLVDRTKTDYSMTFDAILETGNHPSVLAQALLVPPYNRQRLVIAETIMSYPRKSTIPIELFSDRGMALSWLRERRDSLLLSGGSVP